MDCGFCTISDAKCTECILPAILNMLDKHLDDIARAIEAIEKFDFSVSAA